MFFIFLGISSICIKVQVFNLQNIETAYYLTIVTQPVFDCFIKKKF